MHFLVEEGRAGPLQRPLRLRTEEAPGKLTAARQRLRVIKRPYQQTRRTAVLETQHPSHKVKTV